MRTLLLLRGAPGSGKSTWIKDNGLEPYTISADSIRLLFQSPVYDPETGYCGISQDNDKAVWKFLYDRVEERMSRGEFIVIDATNKSVRKWKEYADKYRYRVFVKQFDTPLQECIRRNQYRESWKYVPVNIIVAMHKTIESEPIPSFATRIHEMRELNIHPADFSDYRHVYLIGDIHGCLDPLLDFFTEHPYSDKDAYIFLGDYVDRGTQNRETLEFLSTFTARKNVIFLEGNHVWERYWAKGQLDKIHSGEFLEHTMPQLEGMDKGVIRNWTNRWSQFCYFRMGYSQFLATHAGLGFMPDPDEFIKIPAIDFIKGRNYSDDVDAMWEDKMINLPTVCDPTKRPPVTQIHGHRNKHEYREDALRYSINLCSPIEFGEDLVVCRLTVIQDSETREFFRYKNTKVAEHLHKPAAVVKEERKADKEEETPATEVGKLIQQLRKSKDVVEKKMNDRISSFNFKRSVFYSGRWTELSKVARGLFIDVKNEKILARSYPKFFNIGERKETEYDALKENLKFPVDLYLKENGYLGLLSYDTVKEDLMFCSKSSTHSWYAVNFKRIFEETIPEDKRESIKQFLKDYDVTFVCEVIDPVNDPHIIEYTRDRIVLLDVVLNTVEFKPYDYHLLSVVASNCGLDYKFRIWTANCWDDIKMPTCKWEGCVITDSDNFMVKYKTDYYNKWKRLRGALEAIRDSREVKVAGPDYDDVISFMRELKSQNKLPDNIIEVRNEYTEYLKQKIAEELRAE